MAAATSDTLFSGLPSALSASLFRQARGEPTGSPTDAFAAGDSGDGCYQVEEELLKVTSVPPLGGERILAVLGPGELVGELVDDRWVPRSASVSGIHESKLSFVSRAVFNAVAHTQPEIYRHITAFLARRLRDVDDALTATSFLPLKARTARALLSLSDAFGKEIGSGRVLIRQKFSQSDLAAMAGIARENCSRILQDWTRRSLVSRLAGYYCLENKPALEPECGTG